MSTQILSGEDIRFYAQQPEYEVSTMVGQMTTLMQNITSLQSDTDDKVKQLESQGWFKRMTNTLFGKNKTTKQEIQKNNDKVVTYISQSVSQLYQMNLINERAICSLGNRMNEVYMQVTEMYQEQLNMKAQISEIMAVQQQTLESLGAFVSKLNEKIESVDNFHMLISEMQNGMYCDSSRLYNICSILAQLDKRQMDDSRKMNLLVDTMQKTGIITDDELTVLQCLQEIVALPQEKIGIIYLELCNFRNSFPANLFADMIESYHFLSKMEKMSKKKEVIIQRVLDYYELDADAAFSIADIAYSFIENKQASLVNVSNIKQIETNETAYNGDSIQEEMTNERIHEIWDEMTADLDFDSNSDWHEVIEFLEPLAKQGFVEAQSDLGVAYQIKNNHRKALEWYLKAAEQGDAPCQASVAEYYAGYCEEIEADIKKAEYWFRKCVDNENCELDDIIAFADFLYEIEKFSEAVKWYRKAAEQGNASAQYLLGSCYDLGKGVKENHQEAVKWYRKAAEQGYEKAIKELEEFNCSTTSQKNNKNATSNNSSNNEIKIGSVVRRLCDTGKNPPKWKVIDILPNGSISIQNVNYGTVQKVQKSEIVLYDEKNNNSGVKSNAQNNSSSQQSETEELTDEDLENIAYALYYGPDNETFGIDGIEQDYNEAAEIFEDLAQKGMMYSQYMFGEMCYYGEGGLQKNFQRAAKWYRKAAEQGVALAQNTLGLLYYNGNGVKQSYQEAFNWFKKAAAQDNASANFNIGIMYEDGSYVQQDYSKAEEYFIKAADLGYQDAIEHLTVCPKCGGYRINTEVNDHSGRSALKGGAAGAIGAGVGALFGPLGILAGTAIAGKLACDSIAEDTVTLEHRCTNCNYYWEEEV